MQILLLFLCASNFLSSFSYEFSNENRFSLWLKKYLIKFNDEDHKQHIFNNWMENDKYIQEVNNKNLTYSLDHNRFSGMDSYEYSEYLNLKKDLFSNFSPKKIKQIIDKVKCLTYCVESFDETKKIKTISCVEECLDGNLDSNLLPESINWVDKGAVTPVKDQGQCGSCWSFSTTGALEGAYYIKNGILESFSEQQLVSCDNLRNDGKDHGCHGGLMDNAFQWIENNGGLCSENDYPYVSGNTKQSENCINSCDIIDNSIVLDYFDVSPNSDLDMMTAISEQPVSIAIQADSRDFQLYSSGVFTAECGTNLDHGVLVVGYGSENGEDYYLVKNSWSEQWGDSGYIKLGRGQHYNDGAGQCGMLMQGSYPIV